MLVKAYQLKAGDIIDKVESNPNIRGTVTRIHRFSNEIAARKPQPQQQHRRHVPIARAIAREVERCYDEQPLPGVVVCVGSRHVSLDNDTNVSIWATATQAVNNWMGR